MESSNPFDKQEFSDVKFPAQWIIYWPGQTTSMCDKHKEAALKIASAMGFQLDVREIPAGMDYRCKNCEDEACQ